MGNSARHYNPISSLHFLLIPSRGVKLLKIPEQLLKEVSPEVLALLLENQIYPHSSPYIYSTYTIYYILHMYICTYYILYVYLVTGMVSPKVLASPLMLAELDGDCG